MTVEVKRSKVAIVGFAPDSRGKVSNVINDPEFEIWGLNELYMEPDMQQIMLHGRANRWYQLHGYEPPKVRDQNQVANLASLNCPVVMWNKHPQIPNSVPYPLHEILKTFDVYGEGMAPDRPQIRSRVYFTNTISWMIAQAIYEDFKEIHLYGVNMAQEQEYGKQRPSCEFFIAWARGNGRKIYLPPESDLCKSWLLYGYDDGTDMYQKLYARDKELRQRHIDLQQRRIALQNEAQSILQSENQMLGAIENNSYMINLGPVGVKEIESVPVQGKEKTV